MECVCTYIYNHDQKYLHLHPSELKQVLGPVVSDMYRNVRHKIWLTFLFMFLLSCDRHLTYLVRTFFFAFFADINYLVADISFCIFCSHILWRTFLFAFFCFHIWRTQLALTSSRVIGTVLLQLVWILSGGPRVVVSTAAFHARVRGSVPGLGSLKETKMFLPHPRVKVSIVGSLRDREVACSASDRQGSNFESCVWRAVSSQSSHHPQEVLLAQFSLYVHRSGLKPDSFHFMSGYYIINFRSTQNVHFYPCYPDVVGGSSSPLARSVKICDLFHTSAPVFIPTNSTPHE